MSFRRVGWLALLALAILLWAACGQIYRPVVIPINITPPNPASFHAIFGISANIPFNQGTALQIDVAGDTNIGVANMGINPQHAGEVPNDSRVFVASAGSLYAGDADIVASFFPATDSTTATGLGTPTIFSLPNFGPTNNSGVPAWTCSYLPDFVATSQPTAVYLANYGVEGAASCAANPSLPNPNSTDSIAILNPISDIIATIGYLPPGSHPVGLAETPDGLNLYVLNQGSAAVTPNITDLSPTDLSTVASIPLGSVPAWEVTRVDGQRLYVITQGESDLHTINTATNSEVAGSPQSVGVGGANYVIYDNSRNRLYVTNPNAGAVYVFDTTADPPAPVIPTGKTSNVIPIPAPSPCATAGVCGPVVPVSVAALPDGSRFYVASYVTATGACPDPNLTAAGCVIPQITVFDAGTLLVKNTVFPLMMPVINPVANVQPYAFAPVTYCAPVVPYNPSILPASARFRMSAAAAADSTRVYASICDGGTVAIVHTVTSSIAIGGNAADSLAADLPAPFSAGQAPANGEPPLQNPVFLLTGQ